MNNFMTPLKVGLVVIAGMVATVVLLTRMTADGVSTQSGYVRVYAMFDNVTGLAEKSRVAMAGLPIGVIDTIELEGRRARVEILVRPDVDLYAGIKADRLIKRRMEDGTVQEVNVPYYKNGAQVSKKQAGVIGDSYLELIPGEEGPRISDGGQVFNVNEGVDLEEIFEKLRNITADIETVTNSLAAVLGGDEGQRGLEQILSDLQTTLNVVATFLEESKPKLSNIVANTERVSANVDRIADNGAESVETILADSEDVARDVKSIVQEVKFIIGQSSGDVQEGLGTLSGTLLRLQSTLDSLNYSLQNVQDITDKINEGEGTIGALVNDPGIADKTDQALADISTVTQPIGRLQTVLAVRGEWHFDAENATTALGLKLMPRENKYYFVELVDSWRPLRSREIENTLDAQGNPTGEQETITRRFQFKLTLQYAQIWKLTDWLAVTGRFGLMESRGAVGGNVDTFWRGNRAELRADFFDVDPGFNPRVRLLGKIFPWFAPNIFVLLGGDDILNDSTPFARSQFKGRNFVLGLGLEFNDKDLKGILATTGVPATP